MGHYINLRDCDVAIMNHDHIVIFSMLVGALPGFLFGYMKGHENGLKQARQSYRRLTRQMEQHKVNR
jgi:hypothetical protein